MLPHRIKRELKSQDIRAIADLAREEEWKDIYEYILGRSCIGRERHLCVLWSLYRDLEILRPLVSNAKFICKTCGRVAEKQENLCTPTPI